MRKKIPAAAREYFHEFILCLSGSRLLIWAATAYRLIRDLIAQNQ